MRRTLKPGDPPGVLGRLSLAVVEVGRDGDDRLVHLGLQVLLGHLLEPLQDHRRDLLGAVVLLTHTDPHVAVLRLDDLVGDEFLRLLHFGELNLRPISRFTA